MIADDKPNPFEILGVPTDATVADIGEKAQLLSDTALGDEQRILCRWAREQMNLLARTRLEYEVFEVPGTQYDDPEWERFQAKHRKNPVDRRALAAAARALVLDDFDLVALLSMLLDGLLEVPCPDVTGLVENPPVEAGPGPLALEVRDVVFG